MKKGMMKSKNAIMLVTVGIIVVVLVIAAVIGSMNQGGEAVPMVDVVAVKKGNVTQEVDATGNVESEQQKIFYSPVNATIQNMTVKAGDSVEAGQSLINFNLETLEADNQKAELTARSGKLDLQDAQEQANTAAAKVADAQAAIPGLESQIEEKKNEIAALKQEIANAQVNAQDEANAQLAQVQEDAKAAYEAAVAAAEQKYQEQMNEYETVTKPEYDAKLKELGDKLESGEASAKDQEDYRNLLENPPAEPVKEEINQADYSISADSMSGNVTANTSDLEAQIETASSDLAQLQSELASKQAIAETDTAGLTNAAKEKMQISTNLSELEAKNLQELLEEGRKGIQAEFKGVISEAQVAQGATVTQGMQLLTLQSTEQVCVDAKISKYDFDKVKEGQKAVVTLGDKKYNGTVNRVSKIAIPNEKGTPLIGVNVHIDNPDDDIFIGVEAKVSIQAAEAKDALLLPVGAVNIGKEGSFCYVVDNGVIKKKNIETGVTSDSYVEVKSGLKNSEQVILDMGSYSEGDTVQANVTDTEEEKTSK